jgi:ribA/ribD-fused uncharacterized protein
MIAEFKDEYEFLSNFYPSPFTVDGIYYPTVEHYFQAMKTLNVEKRKEIAAASTPGRAKRLGRTVELRPDWEEVKIDVMRNGLAYKFAHHPDLRQKLITTKGKTLIEGNFWHDNTWGDCYCENCKDTKGKNLLGRSLMALRDLF